MNELSCETGWKKKWGRKTQKQTKYFRQSKKRTLEERAKVMAKLVVEVNTIQSYGMAVQEVHEMDS